MFKINKIFLLIPLTLVFFALLYVSKPLVHSQNPISPPDYILLSPLPGTEKTCSITTPGQCTTDLATYVKGLFALTIGVAAVLAVIMIVIGGVQYMSTDAISGKSEGKEKITQALYGLLLAISCWLILYVINPNLLNFDVMRSVPVSYTPSYFTAVGGSVPRQPGWYTRYQARCEGHNNNLWSTYFYGPVSEASCRSHIPSVYYCQPIAPATSSYPVSFRDNVCTYCSGRTCGPR